MKSKLSLLNYNMSRVMQMINLKPRALNSFSNIRGVTVSGHLKLPLVDIASCVERMGLAIDPNFEKDEHNQMERKLIIHDMQIKGQFTI